VAHVQDLWEKTVGGRRVRTSRYGKGNRWQARYLDPDGHERTRTFARKQDAERFVVTVRADVLRGAYVDPDAGKVTFAEFAKRWLAAQTFDESSREATELRLRLHGSRHFGHRELRSIKPSIMQAWLRKLQQELAPGYVRTVFTNVSSVFNAAVDDGLITTNPCRAGSVKLPKREQRKIEPWTIEQVDAVLAALPDRYRPIGVVAAGCGLRQGEVFGLRLRDADFLRRQLHVEQQVKVLGGRVLLAPPKGGKTRTVPLPDAVGTELADHLRGWPAEGDGLVFRSREGKPINRNHFNPYTWKPALKAAGMPPTRDNGMHALRHFYASVLIDAGESVRAVADYLGHADPGLTLRVYARLFPSSEEHARKALDRVLGERGAESVTRPAYDDGGSRRPR
jgi:integrase